MNRQKPETKWCLTKTHKVFFVIQRKCYCYLDEISPKGEASTDALQEVQGKEGMAGNGECFCLIPKPPAGISGGGTSILPGPHAILRGQENWVWKLSFQGFLVSRLLCILLGVTSQQCTQEMKGLTLPVNKAPVLGKSMVLVEHMFVIISLRHERCTAINTATVTSMLLSISKSQQTFSL